MKIKFNFEWTDKISSGLSFTLILLLSFIVAWMTSRAAQQIINNPPQAIVRGIEK